MPRKVSAAPHLPAGILSPYRDGERGPSSMASPITSVAERGPALKLPFLPVSIRGEMSGRTMRGGANFTK
ncbi:hypothetical protein FJ943_02285 [Mesorhizobium sp. B2-3-10]|nr:hypothetical protein FJ943_02285 [Mesorhizobium sp. B2-3-10]